MSDTYLISYGEYMGMEPDLAEYVGTFRELLIHLCCGGEGTHPFTSYNVKELTECFNDMNGDGQPYIQVWKVGHGKVLG